MGKDEPRSAVSELPLPPHVFEILLALSDGPIHGYGIVKKVGEQSGGTVALSTSSLYAALGKLSDRGLVEEAGEEGALPSGGPPRRRFRITGHGRRVALLEAERLRRVTALASERLSNVAVAGE
jgi:DNA-binding PadR family transcriptional regulator